MLPDGVVQAMLRRELLLTRAKLHALTYEHIMGERKMRAFKSQLKQARRRGPAPPPTPALQAAGRCALAGLKLDACRGRHVDSSPYPPPHGRHSCGHLWHSSQGLDQWWRARRASPSLSA